MTGQQIVDKAKELNLPKGSYVIFGSCPMAVAGIRESSDIDMLVSEEVFSNLAKGGWKILDKGGKDKPLLNGDFEAHKSWEFSSYAPTLDHLLARADYVDGIPFASLQEVRKWKVASGRPKDLLDIELIDEYLSRQYKPVNKF